MKNQSSFSVYKQIKKSAVKVLISNGVKVRKAFDMLRESMPYLFNGKSYCEQYDKENQF